MTVEQQFFISLLRDYIHQDTSEAPVAEIDWDIIRWLAVKQNLSGIIYYQTRDLPGVPESILHKLKEGFLSDVYVSVNTDFAYRKIAEQFDQMNIKYMPFKGRVLRNYYPHPEFRTMGDRDILIHPHDRHKSDGILCALGYHKFVDNHAVWTYHKENLMFEIHDVMFYEDLTNQVDYRGYFSHIWDSGIHSVKPSMEYLPDQDLHFLYSMVHTAKHIINNGIGFRAFLDMAFFVKNASRQGRDPDWEWIRKELITLQLYDFTSTCFSLCEQWFGVTMPFHREALGPGFLQETTDKIFRDGMFGLENEENTASKSAKEIYKSNHSYLFTALRLTLQRLFPPYEDLQLIPWYSWVDGKPWLTPLAWLYRWGYCLKNKWKASRNLLLEPFEKKETIDERQRYLNRWGL